MHGEGAGHMTLGELQALEKHLEIWMCQIRSTKARMLCLLPSINLR